MSKQPGFGVLGIVLTVIVVSVIGFSGWYVLSQNQSNKKDQVDASQQESSQEITQNNENLAKTTHNKKDYLVVEEWGLRFKVPDNLSNVEYRINGDTASFFAIPRDYDVKYRDNYDEFFYDQDSDLGYYKYSMGDLYRYTVSSIDIEFKGKIEGKSIGSYYYYTSHAFNSLATGAGPSGIFLDDKCDKDLNFSNKCSELIDAENKAFLRINTDDDGLLKSIEESN